jgi:hypothetical protein
VSGNGLVVRLPAVIRTRDQSELHEPGELALERARAQRRLLLQRAEVQPLLGPKQEMEH